MTTTQLFESLSGIMSVMAVTGLTAFAITVIRGDYRSKKSFLLGRLLKEEKQALIGRAYTPTTWECRKHCLAMAKQFRLAPAISKEIVRAFDRGDFARLSGDALDHVVACVIRCSVFKQPIEVPLTRRDQIKWLKDHMRSPGNMEVEIISA